MDNKSCMQYSTLQDQDTTKTVEFQDWDQDKVQDMPSGIYPTQVKPNKW